MRQVWDSLGGDVAAAAPRYIDGVVYDGVDPAAPRRAHARVLTTARQVAERGQTGPAERCSRISSVRAPMPMLVK